MQYNYDFAERRLNYFLIVAAIILFASIFLSSCNPYKQITKHPPLTHKDSVRLAYVCSAVYPIDTTSIKYDTVVVKAGNDSTAYLQHQIDSIKKLKPTEKIVLETKYRDTCKSAIGQYETGYNKGFDLGYREGYKWGKINCTPDSFYINKTFTVVDPVSIKIEQDKRLKAEAEYAKEAKKNSTKNGIIYTLIGLLILIIGAAYFIIKRK